MITFLPHRIEVVAKRSALVGSSNLEKTVSFLSMVNSALGEVHCNFDAETTKEELLYADYEKVVRYNFGWSETFQTSRMTHQDYGILKSLFARHPSKISLNLVIGNSAYGLNPSFQSLERTVSAIVPVCNGKVKLGVEGVSNGRKAIDLAARTGMVAYILHTPHLKEAITYA